ncbi:MAG: hypothetical protein J7K51_07810 [Thermotogae bacterium]|nr:hypothetical protein [Thermotogota bacterium]
MFAKYSMKELLDELDIIEFYQQPGNRGYVDEITGKQKALYDAMEIQVPT